MKANPSRQDSQVQLRYRKLVENLPGCIVFVLDRDLRVTFAGGGLVSHARFRPHTYLGSRVAEFMNPALYAYAEPFLLATLAGEEKRFGLDYRGGLAFEVRTTPLQDDNGPATEMLAVVLDTTERRRVEAAEQSAQWVLQQAVQATNIGLWDYDLQARRIHYSRECKQQLGCEDSEISDDLDEWDRRLHLDDKERVRGVIAAYLAAPWPNYEQEFRLQHKDGSYRWILARGTVHCDASGKPAHVLGVHIDITERRRAEDALRASEAALQRSQAVAHVGHWLWKFASDTTDGKTNGVAVISTVWSDELKRIVGIDPALFENNLVEMFQYIIHPDDQVRLWEECSRLLRDPQPAHTEFRVVRPDGSVRYLWAAVDEGICDAAGNMIRRSGVVQDITERKLRETEREQLREQLQRQEQLAAVGQLAAGIAHDFNNIMSVISVYAEMVGAAPGLGDKDRARTQTIVDQTRRATRMIRQILDFSRQAVYERQMLDLLPLLKEEARLLRQTLPESIEVRLDYIPGEYFVLADPTRMQQMIVNLALNARDAMPDGGVLHLVLGRTVVGPGQRAPAAGMAAGTWVQICVADTGAGIRPEYLEHIFEPFFTTKMPGRGTGLGLAQVQGIVAQHEGHIATASELGSGTIFTVYLPAAGTQSWPLPHAVVPAAKALPLGRGECVLLVEDDGEVRTSLAALLEEWNYRVVQAANGQEALAWLARPLQQVDVILSDVVMPRLGGLGLVKALRQDGIGTPVILMSGYAAGEARAGMRDAGVLAWLDKPLCSATLAGALAGALAGGD